MLALIQTTVTLLAGLLLADFASGVIHWVIDRYIPGSTPVVGTHFVGFIHEHHERPHAMFQLSWLVNNAGFFVLVGSLFGLCWALGGLNSVTISAFAFGACANQVHAWAHRRPRHLARIVRPLQQLGILQSPRHHGVHHGASPTEHYCLITDWVNPVVDRLDLWRRAEVGLSCLGLKPTAYARPNPNFVTPTAADEPGIRIPGWRRAMISHISALPKTRRPMFAYRFNASLPMQLDRQPVEGKGARAERT